jgi:hypothetical protein
MLFLALNGLNTGIALNLDAPCGLGTSLICADPLPINTAVTQNNSAILQSLRATDTLGASVLDLSSARGNSPLVITGGRGFQTLAINGTDTAPINDPSAAPESGTVALTLTGVALVIAGHRKRRS